MHRLRRLDGFLFLFVWVFWHYPQTRPTRSCLRRGAVTSVVVKPENQIRGGGRTLSVTWGYNLKHKLWKLFYHREDNVTMVLLVLQVEFFFSLSYLPRQIRVCVLVLIHTLSNFKNVPFTLTIFLTKLSGFVCLRLCFDFFIGGGGGGQWISGLAISMYCDNSEHFAHFWWYLFSLLSLP